MNINYKSDHTFYGGSALLVQYYDLIKPIYLMALLKALINKDLRFGLPFDHLEKFSLPSIIEAYINRAFINPFYLVDPGKRIKKEDLDKMLSVITEDESLYTLAPPLETNKMISLISIQKLGIPVYYYSETYNNFIEREAKQSFGINYLYGPIEEIVKKIPNNFSMIFSDITLAQRVFHSTPETTIGSIMIADDYQYNYTEKGEFKVDFNKEILNTNHIFMKVSGIQVIDRYKLIKEIQKIMEKF